jgi:hypothetical protein
MGFHQSVSTTSFYRLDGLAHAFKTPLATIQSASSGLLEINRIEYPERELVSLIDEQTTRLAKLTNQVLRTAELDQRHLEVDYERIGFDQLFEFFRVEANHAWPIIICGSATKRRIVTYGQTHVCWKWPFCSCSTTLQNTRAQDHQSRSALHQWTLRSCSTYRMKGPSLPRKKGRASFCASIGLPDPNIKRLELVLACLLPNGLLRPTPAECGSKAIRTQLQQPSFSRCRAYARKLEIEDSQGDY